MSSDVHSDLRELRNQPDQSERPNQPDAAQAQPSRMHPMQPTQPTQPMPPMPPPQRNGAAPSDQPAPDRAPAADQPSGQANGQANDLPPGASLTIGRSPANDITLDDPLVGAQQARLTRAADGACTLQSLDSGRPIYVNGLPVTETQLAPNAEVQMGRSSFVFTGARLVANDSLNAIQIDALHLDERVRVGPLGSRHKTLLDDISLSIPPGAFVAIVGSSGSGKTTLLNALTGQRPAERGVVLYNGRGLYQEIETFSQTQGYVPQDDIIHKYLTVERALYYAARLRLPAHVTRRQIRARIAEVLEDIDMTAQRHQVISRLSGGQRKRVSIGVELLARPGVFFLDEPTSGLDPALDRHVMQLLRKLADRGQTVVMTTHTMAHIDVCDYVCFLAPGGRLAYFGSPQQMQAHFQMSDYADIFAAIHSDPDHWVALFRQTPDYLRLVAGPQLQSENKSQSRPIAERAVVPTVRRVGAARQLLLLTLRYLEIFLRDRTNLLILLAQAPIIALLVAILTDHNVVHNLTAMPNLMPPHDIYAQRSLFIMVCSAAWFGIINAAREIVKERPIYRRERAIYLSIIPYAFSKAIVLGGLAAIQSAILLLIVGSRAGYPTHGLIFAGGMHGAFAEMLLTLWLVTLAGVAMGLMVSALAPNADRAVSLTPLLLVPQIIFANVIFTLSNGTDVISYFAPSRWGMQALGSIARVRDRFAGQDHPFYSTAPSHLVGFWLALAGLIALYFILGLLALRRSDGPERHTSSRRR